MPGSSLHRQTGDITTHCVLRSHPFPTARTLRPSLPPVGLVAAPQLKHSAEPGLKDGAKPSCQVKSRFSGSMGRPRAPSSRSFPHAKPPNPEPASEGRAGQRFAGARGDLTHQRVVYVFKTIQFIRSLQNRHRRNGLCGAAVTHCCLRHDVNAPQLDA